MTEKRTRRVITGHDANGKAVIAADTDAPNVKVRTAAGGLISTLLWVTDQTPAVLDGDADGADRDMGVAPPPAGSVFRIVDFPPADTKSGSLNNDEILREMGIASATTVASRSPFMHRTKSIDYAIVISGELWMLVDEDETLLKAGDVIIQKATNHAWENRSSDWCRVAFVLIDAEAPAVWKSSGASGH